MIVRLSKKKKNYKKYYRNIFWTGKLFNSKFKKSSSKTQLLTKRIKLEAVSMLDVLGKPNLSLYEHILIQTCLRIYSLVGYGASNQAKCLHTNSQTTLHTCSKIIFWIFPDLLLS